MSSQMRYQPNSSRRQLPRAMGRLNTEGLARWRIVAGQFIECGGSKDERRVETAVKIAHFRSVRDLDGCDFAAQR